MPRLQDKVAIVTGGAASIGAAIVRGLHAEGARVVIADLKTEEGEALAVELGANALFVHTDITDDERLRALVAAAVEQFGALDILVNCAANYGDDGAETSRDTWLATLDTNVVSVALLGELAVEHLERSGGNIVNIGSVSGRFPHIQRWAYPVSKAALAHLSKTQAVEYADRGVRVNMVTLGHTWSAPFEGLTGNNRKHADAVCASYNLMGRIADADEVARVVAFVASREASYMNGGEIPVDGGYGALGPEQHYPLMPRLMEGSRSEKTHD